MKQQTETPLYATLLYEVRKKLDITWIEYVYLDMVYHLSKDGWCYKSLENCGQDLGLDRSNVYKMRKRLIARGLLVKSLKGHVKTSVTYAKHIRSNDTAYAKRTKPYAKRDFSVGETRPKNNNRITIEKANKDFREIPSPAKERIRDMFKHRAQHGN